MTPQGCSKQPGASPAWARFKVATLQCRQGSSPCRRGNAGQGKNWQDSRAMDGALIKNQPSPPTRSSLDAWCTRLGGLGETKHAMNGSIAGQATISKYGFGFEYFSSKVTQH